MGRGVMRPGVGAGCRRDLARCWPLLSRATDRGEDLHLSFNQILAGSQQINFPEASSPAKWEACEEKVRGVSNCEELFLQREALSSTSLRRVPSEWADMWEDGRQV